MLFELDAVGLKKCFRCKQVKSLSDFTRNRGTRDGLEGSCRTCTSARNKLSYVRNFDAEKARKAKAYAADPGKILARNRKWREANRERERATNTAYYWKNREIVQGWHKAYHEANPHVMRAANARRRARRVTPPGIIASQAIVEQRMAYFGYKCWMCGGPFEHVDHVKPLAKGGLHIASNLRPACARCNLSKHHKWPFDTTVCKAAT